MKMNMNIVLNAVMALASFHIAHGVECFTGEGIPILGQGMSRTECAEGEICSLITQTAVGVRLSRGRCISNAACQSQSCSDGLLPGTGAGDCDLVCCSKPLCTSDDPPTTLPDTTTTPKATTTEITTEIITTTTARPTTTTEVPAITSTTEVVTTTAKTTSTEPLTSTVIPTTTEKATTTISSTTEVAVATTDEPKTTAAEVVTTKKTTTTTTTAKTSPEITTTEKTTTTTIETKPATTARRPRPAINEPQDDEKANPDSGESLHQSKAVIGISLFLLFLQTAFL